MEFVAVECALIGCGQWFLHHQIENHKNHFCKFRPYSCKYCQYCSTFKGVTELHYGQCGSYPVSCPQNCSNKKFERQALSSHLNGDCLLVVVLAPLASVGARLGCLERTSLSMRNRQSYTLVCWHPLPKVYSPTGSPTGSLISDGCS